MKKRILYIQSRPGGGSLIALYDMLKVLDKSRFEPIVFCYEQNTYTTLLDDLQVTVLYYKKKDENDNEDMFAGSRAKVPIRIIRQLKRLLVNDVQMAKHIQQVIVDRQIDLIHHNTDFPYVRQGLIASRKTGLPQVCHYRSFKAYTKGGFDWWVDRYFAKKIHHHIYISLAVRDHFEKWLKIKSSKGCVVRDIVDPAKFKPGISYQQTMQDLRLSKDEIIITNIGRIIHWKGQHVFIDAFAKVAAKYPAARALVVGPYESGVGNNFYYEELIKQSHDLGLKDKIIFTGNRNDVPEIIAMSNCVVHSSVTPEPQGLVIIEALFSKKPVVVTDAGGAAELIVNKEGGLKVPAGNADAMADAICDLLSRQQVIANAPTPSILKEFEPKKQIKVIEDIYDKLLNSNVVALLLSFCSPMLYDCLFTLNT